MLDIQGVLNMISLSIALPFHNFFHSFHVTTSNNEGEIVLILGKPRCSRPKIALYILLNKVAPSPSFTKRRGWTVSNQPSPVKNLCIKRIVFGAYVLRAALPAGAGAAQPAGTADSG